MIENGRETRRECVKSVFLSPPGVCSFGMSPTLRLHSIIFLYYIAFSLKNELYIVGFQKAR